MSFADELIKLNQLRQDGVLSDEQFESQKKTLLEGGPSAQANTCPENLKWAEVKLWKKLWFQGLTGVLIAYPAGIILLTVFPSYAKQSGGLAKRCGKGLKAFIVFSLICIWMSKTLPTLARDGWNVAEVSSELPTCDSSETEEALERIISKGPHSHLVNLELLEVTKATEISYDKIQTVRTCRADLVLNSGRESVRFKISRAKVLGEFLVEILG
jgi:hypothetical protein